MFTAMVGAAILAQGPRCLLYAACTLLTSAICHLPSQVCRPSARKSAFAKLVLSVPRPIQPLFYLGCAPLSSTVAAAAPACRRMGGLSSPQRPHTLATDAHMSPWLARLAASTPAPPGCPSCPPSSGSTTSGCTPPSWAPSCCKPPGTVQRSISRSLTYFLACFGLFCCYCAAQETWGGQGDTNWGAWGVGVRPSSACVRDRGSEPHVRAPLLLPPPPLFPDLRTQAGGGAGGAAGRPGGRRGGQEGGLNVLRLFSSVRSVSTPRSTCTMSRGPCRCFLCSLAGALASFKLLCPCLLRVSDMCSAVLCSFSIVRILQSFSRSEPAVGGPIIAVVPCGVGCRNVFRAVRHAGRDEDFLHEQTG